VWQSGEQDFRAHGRHPYAIPEKSMPFRLKIGRGWWTALGAFLAWTVIFAILYAQSPLYTSNQNQYFLHGMARAGLGLLNQDWLANTPDPTPLFSALISLTYALTNNNLLFYVYYALLMGLYLFSVYGLMDLLFELRHSKTRSLLFLALFLGAHSAALRYLLSKLAGPEATFLVEGGVAGQRLLGQVFQPSTFAVFLVLSLYLFLARRRNWAILALVVAVTAHPTYLLCGGLMTLAYLWMIHRETRQVNAVITYGLKILIPVLPILVYTLLIFSPSNPILYAEAQHVLVYFRIPPHALVSQWLNWTVAVQGIFILSALVVMRRKPIFPIYLFLTSSSVLLTLVQAAIGSNTLALLFPWRASILLVPLGVSVLIAALVTRVMDVWQPSPPTRRWLRLLSLIVIAMLMAVGVTRFQIEYADLLADPANPMMGYVAAHKSPGDLYLTPSKLANFRLVTGAPVLADFDSIPYRDVDIMEWYQRLQWASYFYESGQGDDPCKALKNTFTNYGVNYAVVERSNKASVCRSLPVVYQDATYRIYALSPQK
jgi:hypothetical protein